MAVPVDQCVREFARFLSAGWPLIDEMVATIDERAEPFGKEDLVSAWQQANWEILVEARLERGCYLVEYAGGADVHDHSGRVTMPDVTPTHFVVCHPVNPVGVLDYWSKRIVEFPVEGFSVDELVDWFERSNRFEYVSASRYPETFIFAAVDVTFDIRKLDPSEW